MRRIAALLSVAIIFVIVNFCLWFYHSRALHDSVNFTKRIFAAKNLDFTYKDIYFETFKFWNLRTVIEGVRISSSTNEYIEFENIELESHPFSKKIIIKPENAIRYSTSSSFTPGIKQVIYSNDNAPTMVLHMDSFLETLNNGLFNSSARNPMGNINKVDYKDAGFTVVDTTSNTEYFTAQPSTAGYKFYQEKFDRGFYVSFENNGFGYSNSLSSQDAKTDKFLSDLKALGQSKLALTFKFRHYYSEEYKNYLNDAAEDNKDISDARSDMFEASVPRFNFSNDVITFNLNGSYHKKQSFGSLPYFDFVASIDNYPQVVSSYWNLLQQAAALTPQDEIAKMPVKFNDSTEKALLKFFDLLAGDKKPNLEIHVIRTELNPDIKVNDLPALKVLGELNKVFPELIPINNNLN